MGNKNAGSGGGVEDSPDEVSRQRQVNHLMILAAHLEQSEKELKEMKQRELELAHVVVRAHCDGSITLKVDIRRWRLCRKRVEAAALKSERIDGIMAVMETALSVGQHARFLQHVEQTMTEIDRGLARATGVDGVQKLTDDWKSRLEHIGEMTQTMGLPNLAADKTPGYGSTDPSVHMDNLDAKLTQEERGILFADGPVEPLPSDLVVPGTRAEAEQV